jgi:WD40 repeat protein
MRRSRWRRAERWQCAEPCAQQASIQTPISPPCFVQKNGNSLQGAPHSQMKAPHTGPVLSCCWSAMGDKIFTGSADKTGKAWDLNSQQAMQFAAHDAPIKSVHFVEQHNMIVTASWDKTLKYWKKKISYVLYLVT